MLESGWDASKYLLTSALLSLAKRTLLPTAAPSTLSTSIGQLAVKWLSVPMLTTGLYRVF